MTPQANGELPHTEARSGLLLDEATPLELVQIFQQADREATAAVVGVEVELAEAIERAAEAIGSGGRLILLGAGTSGRLAVIEAAECWPTFGTRQVVGLIAGGAPALLVAQEGAEDSATGGASDLAELAVEARDFVVGIAASGRTPYVHGALRAARQAGAGTALLCASPPPPDGAPVDLVLILETGPEVLSGSTRLKAGTATKCALNALTTGAMSRLGAIMGDLMVDFVASNTKLVARAKRMLCALTELDPSAAEETLQAAEGDLKVAVLMARLGLDAASARAHLASRAGHLPRALADA
ncbi:MAG: N-acetylmuramic acid 6-phosphate etherase [Planctomycetes bacterium]|nr:N-acetylmuramic acid 6-phosphate etherase [Planctomycetota bacterium]